MPVEDWLESLVINNQHLLHTKHIFIVACNFLCSAFRDHRVFTLFLLSSSTSNQLKRALFTVVRVNSSILPAWQDVYPALIRTCNILPSLPTTPSVCLAAYRTLKRELVTSQCAKVAPAAFTQSLTSLRMAAGGEE